ncbi:metallophosphoesterase [Corynebacterium alimapuense]|uniref:Metallophosphoesterase n=1 Tax=Corynebacterium alimapuense TaxID=1576874 RepID=A0A3M8K8D5_9CORY|nr:metallophosphoesterase [Corynebacterium alimapuense]RNE49025.1 metallophosphoesterase [Corynebacterium alimapuense]
MKLTPKVTKRLLNIASAIGAAGIAGAGIAAWGHAELRKFELKQVSLPLLAPGTLRGRDEFTILHISDLHMIPGQDTKIAWVSALDALNPDLVVNTGDNLSDAHAVPDVLRALGPLLNRPGMFIFGTNDYWAPRLANPFSYLFKRRNTPSYVDLPWRDMRAAFIERGWQDATHRRLEFQVGPVRIAAAGVDDPHHDLDDYQQIAGAPNVDADLSLALLHAPEPRVLAQFAEDGYQLSLSGHTHGGQLCLPGSTAIVTNCGIDRARVQGLHTFGGMLMHVSNGLGTSKFVPFRLFCRPSATLLRISERPD